MGTKFEVTFEVDDQLLADVITTAVEGGIGYWSQALEYKWQDREPKNVFAVIADEEGDTHSIDISVIADGIKKAILPGSNVDPRIQDYIVRALRDGDAGEIDSDAADVIVQLGVLDKVVYA